MKIDSHVFTMICKMAVFSLPSIILLISMFFNLRNIRNRQTIFTLALTFATMAMGLYIDSSSHERPPYEIYVFSTNFPIWAVLSWLLVTNNSEFYLKKILPMFNFIILAFNIPTWFIITSIDSRSSYIVGSYCVTISLITCFLFFIFCKLKETILAKNSSH